MSFGFYKVLHIIGALLLFMSLGGALMHAFRGETKDKNPFKGLLAATHGIAMLILLVAGFGAAGKGGFFANGMPGWVIAKLVVWFFFGGVLAAIGRKPQSSRPLWILLPILGGVAVWLAVNKPF